ncbi:MAG: OmpH family outer membrane protein [Phycisphaerales bacterium]|nr:OmpH family outer membrane protein [Phycisphaerales bacterium]
MGRAERLFVYSLLAILLVSVFGRDLGNFGAPATAEAPAMKETLGPADELLLTGKDGPLAITNGEGHVAWGTQDTSRAWSVAAVNLSDLMPAVLARDVFQEEMKDLEETAMEQNAEFEAQFKGLQDEYGEIGPDDPKFAEAQGRAQALMAKYQEWQQATMQVRSKKASEQVEQAYREVIEAVAVVAENQQIDMVYRFIPTDSEFKSDTLEQAQMQIQLRTFLKYPDQVDITETVKEELGL